MIGVFGLPCLIGGLIMPLVAVFAALVLRGKGYEDEGVWAWRGAALLLVAGLPTVIGGAGTFYVEAEWMGLVGMALTLGLQFTGNVCLGLAAARDGAGRPAQVYIVGVVAFVVLGIAAAGLVSADRLGLELVGGIAVLLVVPLGLTWFGSAGAGMAAIRAAMAERRFDDAAEREG